MRKLSPLRDEKDPEGSTSSEGRLKGGNASMFSRYYWFRWCSTSDTQHRPRQHDLCGNICATSVIVNITRPC